MLKKTGTKLISLFLVLMLLTNLTFTPALAYVMQNRTAKGLTLTAGDGSLITVDESWESLFPYGTFAFETAQVPLLETGGPQTIKVYRLGGTTGKARVTISVTPVVTETDGGQYSYANAAGTNDFILEAEDTLPIALYQMWGMDAPPLKPSVPVSITGLVETANTLDDDGETVLEYGNTLLTADVEADSYRWQACHEEVWTDVGEDGQTLDVSNEAAESADFRCVFTIDGRAYCTDSWKGEAYEPIDMGGEPIPGDIDLNPPQTFHPVALTAGEYDTYEFYLTFAEGEWVKELRITPVDDDLPESVELVALKMDSSLGGELYDTANTLLCSLEDDEAVLPSFFAFKAQAVTADKAAGSAYLTVERTGAIQYVATVDYQTADGTATAGIDYADTDGTLYFPGGVSEMTIEIPLINDGVVAEESDLAFSVALDNPLGGEGTAVIGDTAATVNLYNTAESDANNLATMLSTPDADDISGDTAVTARAIAPTSAETVLAAPVKPSESMTAEIAFGPAEGEIGTLDYDASGRISFPRNNYNLINFWGDFADLDFMGKSGKELNNNQGLSFTGWDDGQIIQTTWGGESWAYRNVDCPSEYSNRDRWNTQRFADFDQMFSSVTMRYRADTDYSGGGDRFYSTVILGVVNTTNKVGMPLDPQTYEKKVADGQGGSDSGNPPNWVNTPREVTFPVTSGASGIFVAFGDRDSGFWSIGEANAKVWLQAYATRQYLRKPLKYIIHTADDDTIKALGTDAAAQIYESIAPPVSILEREGGCYLNDMLYVGSTLRLGTIKYGTYRYVTQMEGQKIYPIYLSSSSTRRINNTGTSNGANSTLQIMGDLDTLGWSFAGGASNQLYTSNEYSVNVVLNRQQRIAIEIAKSVPRKADGKSIDETRIAEAVTTFWARASNFNIKRADVSSIGEDGSAGAYGAKALFVDKTTYASASDFSDAGTKLTSKTVYDNIKFVNFGLPAADQILFNGVLYKGNEDIPIPPRMFGDATLAFTYYHADYLTALSEMTMTVTRIEQYIDTNGNGQLDGYINESNQFKLEPVNGVYDRFVTALTEEEYSIAKFTPAGDANNTYQQFFKFYYSLSPACLVVPPGSLATDRAQIMPAFVNGETDKSRRAALSAEMQGYRFIQSGPYSKDFSVLNNNDKITITHKAGEYSADGKLMYGAEANAIETVDVPLGGDTNPVPPTYVYTGSNDGGKTTITEQSNYYDPNKDEATSGGYEWYISDVLFKRADWNPQYHGSLLYKFAAPQPIFVSDSLVGENLPVAKLVTKASETNPQDVYSVQDLNNYLGSFNPSDAVMIGVREQEFTTGEIADSFEGLSLFADVIQSGEHIITVDSVTYAGFGTIPDAQGMRRMTGPEDGADRTADSGNSSNSNPEFNMDLGLEMPSLSLGLSDFVTLIIDGDEFGFSIGLPIFSAEKKAENFTSSEAASGSANSKYGAWEKKTPGSEIVENAKKVKDTFTQPGRMIESDDWKAAEKKGNAQHAANQTKKKLDPKADTDNLVKSKGMSFSIAVNVTIMFKWSIPERAFKFSSAMVFLQFGFQFKQTMRLTVCPIVYAYFSLGVSLELAGGVVNEREIVENTTAMIDINKASDIRAAGAGGTDYANGKVIELTSNLSTLNVSEWTVQPDAAASGKYVLAGDKGDAFTFRSKSDAINLYFSGKVKIEVKDGANWKNIGYVASDGSDPVLVMFDDKIDGTANLDVRATILDEAGTIDRIVPISSLRNETFFSGLSLAPSVFLEVGAGIGVEVLKVEIYFKANIGISMSFATRQNNAATKGTQLRDPSSSSLSLGGAQYTVAATNDAISTLDSDIEAFSFDSFTFRAGFGVRVVILLFNFELDVIQFGIDYRKSMVGVGEDGFKTNGWKFAWYALNGGKEITSYDLSDIDDSEGFPGVKITLPSNTFAAQQIFGPEKAQMVVDEIDAMAFDPENLTGNEFQISGYSSSGDAFRLADGLATGTEYKLLAVGDANYLLYTISRANPQNAVDSNMLVLSKLQNTGEAIGLVNPAEPNDPTPYITVDNDGAGDLDFNASANGNTVNVTWISYADTTTADGVAKPVMPDRNAYPIPSYSDGGITTYLNASNYRDAAFIVTDPGPEPTEPAEPKPDTEPVPVEPDGSKYYLSADAYEDLPDDDKPKYKDGPESHDGTDYYVAIGYENYAAADKAYLAAEAQYLADQANKALWDDWTAYETDSVVWPVNKAAYDAYTAWYDYYDKSAKAAAEESELLHNVSQNTVVKTASFTVGTDTAFSPPKVVSAAGDGYLFQPRISNNGKLTFYARSNNFSSEEKDLQTQKAKDYYDASSGSYNTGADGVSSGEGDPTAAFRYAYTTSMNDVYGKNTQFMFTCITDDWTAVHTGFTPNGWDTLGMRLTNSSMTMIDDTTFYLAYTASVTETSVDGGNYGDTTVHKLYLQKGRVNSTTGAVTLDAAKMLRQLVDISGGDISTSLIAGMQTIAQTNGDSTTVDGVYVNDGSGPKQSAAFEDPYFGNLRFLTGRLGGLTGQEENFGESLAFSALANESSTFLLFEMNGNTYVIPESSLGSITDSGTGMIIPFWETKEDDRARSNVVIGADGDGNISAVYTDAIPGTTNNALFVSKYDPDTASFGLGRMLAMNYMQVYEDSVTNGWSPEQTEQAFYGKLPGYNTDENNDGFDDNRNGGLSSFTFSNLDIALGLTKTGDDDQSTLVILSQGTQVMLAQIDYIGSAIANDDGVEQVSDQLIVPKYEDGILQSSTGYYALSFGVGEKAIGEGQMLFPTPDFTPGAILQPTLEFKNTGDVPLRGSPTEPITLQLWLSGPPDEHGNVLAGTEALATWKIETGIAVGQIVRTGYDENFEGLYTSTLPDNLVGRKFYFTVSETGISEETPFGVDNPLHYSSLDDSVGGTTRTIEAKPELAIEDLKFSTVGVDGDRVQIAVSMIVTNRGGADAQAPYLQFTHQTGRTMEDVQPGDIDYQQPIYDVLDISDGTFSISKQQPMQSLALDPDRQNGILRLIGTDPTEPVGERTKLNKGNARTVEGTFWVPKDAYCLATATGSLNMQVEVYNGEEPISSLSSSGLQTSGHGNEYDANNNVGYGELNPQTFFTAPAKVAIPLSTTVRLSVPAVTTETGNPVIAVEELSIDFRQTDEKHLGILYYNMGADGTGKNGYLVISPSSEGSGVIRIIDSVTGSSKDIAFTVTASGSGVNIFRDNNIFTWYNANGNQINPDTGTGVWSFRTDVSAWGNEGLTPYLSDLSRSMAANVSFTFTTLAESIDLYFNGTAAVTCDIPGFKGVTVSAAGGGAPAKITLGANPDNEPRLVKVTATAKDVDFDRFVEHFAGGRDILPDPGSKAPQIWLSRSLPDTASLKNEDYTDDGFVLTAYVLDETGIASLTFKPGTANAAPKNPVIHNAAFRQFDIVVKPTGAAGTFTITATDENGQSTVLPILVDWFNAVVGDADKDTPLSPFDYEWVYRDSAGYPLYGITDTQQLQKGMNAFIAVDTDPDAAVGVEYYDVSVITEVTSYRLEETQPGAWLLFKTVTQTDGSGNQIGESVITQTAATGDTDVPNASVRTITNAGWKTVAVDENTGEYSVVFNTVYKVTAAKDNVSATSLLLMDRLNSDLPTIEIAYTTAQSADNGAYLGYVARKGASSPSGIKSVTINGYNAFTAGMEAPAAVTGDFPISYGGEYTFVVTDAAGNDNSKIQTVTMPIQAQSDDFITLVAPYNNLGNGELTIHSAKLLGGAYDAGRSNPAANEYRNIYEYALTAVADVVSEDGEEDENDEDGEPLVWQTEEVFSDLTPGDYVLYIRDQQEPEIEYLVVNLTVGDGTIVFVSSAIFDRLTNKPTITVAAAGGGGHYEFIAIPSSTQSALLDAAGIEQAIIDYIAAGWTTMETAAASVTPAIAAQQSALSAIESALQNAKAADTGNKINWTAIETALAAAKAIDVADAWAGVKQAIADAKDADPSALPAVDTWDALETTATFVAARAEIESAARTAKDADKDNIINWTALLAATSASQPNQAVFTLAADTIEKTAANTPVWQSNGTNAITWRDIEPGRYQIAVRDSDNHDNMYVGIINAVRHFGSSGGTNSYTSTIAGYTVTTPKSAPPVTDSAGNTVLPVGGTIQMPLGAVIDAPANTKIDPNGLITIGAGGATILLPGPDGITGDPGASDDMILTVPGGTRIAKDGTVTLITGLSASVTMADGQIMNIQEGLTFNLNFSIPLGYFDNPFIDISPNSWYYDDVMFGYTRGLFKGTAWNMFSPDLPMTRAMLVTVLGRMHGVDEGQYTGGSFDDVDAGTYYAAYVKWAQESGIVNGISATRFAPDTAITRQDVAVILHRYAQFAGIDLPEELADVSFSDEADIADYAKAAVNALTRAEIIKGKPEDLFDPRSYATRAEIAAMFRRFILALAEEV